MLINIHRHFPQPPYPPVPEGILEIESRYYGQTGAAAAAYCSVGLHPWYLKDINWLAATQWLQEQIAQPATLLIGEAGLDKVCDTPWAEQLRAFELCAKLAEIAQKPLVIHCVRAYSELLTCKNLWRPTQPWIIHGFNKHPQTAKMLLEAGCLLSFGAAILQNNSHAAEALATCPADCFFLETDDNFQYTIDNIYARAAQIRHCTLEEIVLQVESNFLLLREK
ncbi:MAG: TatD family hydrolase [Chitinophagales bacterium]|nr:TatD family hydrolase [Chitinophagales bacterium]